MDSRTGLPVVGMVGGGQLARMTHQAAIALGQSLRVLAVSADDGAALVAADTVIGHHTDLDALRRFAKGCDVVTFDHEHVPGDHIEALAAEGVTVRPGADALRHAQNKRVMRERLADAGRAGAGLARGRERRRGRRLRRRGRGRPGRRQGRGRRLRRPGRLGARRPEQARPLLDAGRRR